MLYIKEVLLLLTVFSVILLSTSVFPSIILSVKTFQAYYRHYFLPGFLSALYLPNRTVLFSFFPLSVSPVYQFIYDKCFSSIFCSNLSSLCLQPPSLPPPTAMLLRPFGFISAISWPYTAEPVFVNV